jgi:hypothetical protein
MLAFFKTMGARVEHKTVHVPDAITATVATVADGGETVSGTAPTVGSIVLLVESIR